MQTAPSGENGIDNKPTRQLANRTVYLKQELEAAQQSLRNRIISAGAGLTGSGDLSADRRITLATPSTLSGSTANWAGNGTAGHTHELGLYPPLQKGDLGGFESICGTKSDVKTDRTLNGQKVV